MVEFLEVTTPGYVEILSNIGGIMLAGGIVLGVLMLFTGFDEVAPFFGVAAILGVIVYLVGGTLSGVYESKQEQAVENAVTQVQEVYGLSLPDGVTIPEDGKAVVLENVPGGDNSTLDKVQIQREDNMLTILVPRTQDSVKYVELESVN